MRVGGEYGWRLIALAGALGYAGAVAGAILLTAFGSPTPVSVSMAVAGGILGGLTAARLAWAWTMMRTRARLTRLQARLAGLLSSPAQPTVS